MVKGLETRLIEGSERMNGQSADKSVFLMNRNVCNQARRIKRTAQRSHQVSDATLDDIIVGVLYVRLNCD